MPATIKNAPAGPPHVKRDLKELHVLFEISQLLDSSMDLRDVVGPVLETLARVEQAGGSSGGIFPHATGTQALAYDDQGAAFFLLHTK